VLDEAFPSITIVRLLPLAPLAGPAQDLADEHLSLSTQDLVFLRAPFSPAHVHALARRLSVPLARCFMGCPSERWARENSFGVRELAGVRIISD